MTNAAPKAAASRLAFVKKEVLRVPLRYFFYGDNGVGKSTLAAAAPEPIWLDIEDGSSQLKVARYPFRDGEGGHVPRTYGEVVGAIDDLATSPHAFQSVVLDTADALEKLIWAHLVERESAPSARSKDGPLTSIESFGYGKGYVMAVDEWRALCVKLDRLRMTRGMNVVIIAHSIVRTFKSPIGPDYDRYQPALHDKAAGFLKGWSDICGRVCHEETAGKEPGDRSQRMKGFATGRRILQLAHSAAFDAKGRGNLPDEVEIPTEEPWAPLAAAIEAGHETDLKKLTDEIDAETARIGDDALTAKVAPAVRDAVAKKDAQSLKAYLNSLKSRPAKSAEAQQ
jgi:AAA domain